MRPALIEVSTESNIPCEAAEESGCAASGLSMAGHRTGSALIT